MLLEGCWNPPAPPASPAPRTVSGDGSFCAWDGRLDGGAEGVCPEAAALAVWRRSGADGFRGLVGDWSLALWDASSQTLVLASDYAGIRPLYYHFSGGRLLWASSLAELVRRTGARPLDERFAAEFLALAGSRHTPFPGIDCVPPGCAVAVTAAGLRIHRFWHFPAGAADAPEDERAAELGLLDLFREAVAVRTRPYQRVASELSGGLDSSSVVCMAALLGARLNTFSYTQANNTDERYYRAVEQQCGIEGIHLQLDDYPFATPEQTGGAAPAWWEPRFRGLAHHLHALGAGVLLTGQLGDLLMGNVLDDSDQAAGFFRRGHPWQAAREAFGWSQALQIPIYPILWRGLRLAFSSWAPPGASDFSPVGLRRAAVEDSLTAPFRRRAREVCQATEPHHLDWRSAPPESRRRWRTLADLLSLRRFQTPEPLLDLSYAHPFAHRPLVESMLTVPRRFLCRPQEPRRLMRRAFASLLPPAVLNRRSKADYTAAYSRPLRPMALEMIRNPGAIRLVELGFLEPASLRARLDRFTQGLDCNETQLRQILLLEFWLRGS